MTDEQINRAIAEACGIVSKDQYGPLYQTGEGWVVDCPQFATDLNAMHDVEKHLFAARKDNAYGYQLATSDCQTMWYVTARQRAEAFLRTLGKWEEATDKEMAE